MNWDYYFERRLIFSKYGIMVDLSMLARELEMDDKLYVSLSFFNKHFPIESDESQLKFIRLLDYLLNHKMLNEDLVIGQEIDNNINLEDFGDVSFRILRDLDENFYSSIYLSSHNSRVLRISDKKKLIQTLNWISKQLM